MDEHLMRALIEVCYAMADFSYERETREGIEQFDEKRWTMMALVRSQLETLLRIDEQPVRREPLGSDAPTIGQC